MAVPSEPDEIQFKTYVANIVATYHKTNEDQRERGMHWYATARDIALMIAGDVTIGAGVLAALSARTPWEDNVKRATESLATGTPTGHTKANLAKAARIMNGEDPATILPMELKTGHFYRCISDPDNEDAVVIDRHAHDIAVGVRWGDKVDKGLGSKKRYAMFANAYREAARHIGIKPLQLQAVTWVYQVDTYQYKRS